MGNEILLESGTNEVEILEFYLGDQGFGINIAKVAQILPLDREKLTVVPNENAAILGELLWQDGIIPLIDLDKMLNQERIDKAERAIVLVTEFNGVKSGFLTDGVNRIHRVSWENIDPMSSLLGRYSSTCTGSIHINNRDILLVDFEYIIADLYPETHIDYHKKKIKSNDTRGDITIVFAEDSSFIRQTITGHLKDSGYKAVHSFENGSKAFDYIAELCEKAKEQDKDPMEDINILVTDIEMPKLDGLSLCKKVRQDLKLVNLPVIVFSSLVNAQMELKCKEVGANAFMTKPRIDELVDTVDRLLGIDG